VVRDRCLNFLRAQLDHISATTHSAVVQLGFCHSRKPAAMVASTTNRRAFTIIQFGGRSL
jgi:hypothetical protein